MTHGTNISASAAGMTFRKMHGLGNDFVVLDAREADLMLTPKSARAIADRRTGVGCDQIMIIERPRNGGDAYIAIRNSDGGVVESCGNGFRCVAALLMKETGKTNLALETLAGPISASRAGNGLISIDMGLARTEWKDIPLAKQTDTLHMGIGEGALQDPVGVNMGNPHAVFFVPDAAAIDLAVVGPKLEHHTLFPQRANIEVAQVLDRARIRMRVWERGAGITLACGTGACAAVVAAARRGLSDRKATVTLDGGNLEIEWRADNHVIMTGPVAETFVGTLGAGFAA
jgi:diaminopimelate epimerase